MIASVLVALRKLTFGSLAEVDIATRAVESAPASTAIAGYLKEPEPCSALRHNHLLSKSHTSIGVSTELLLEPESYRDQVSGTIEADVRTRVSCGHVGDIAGAFLRAAQGIELPEPQESLAPQRWLLRFSVGENDFQFRWPSDLSVANRGIRVVPIYDLSLIHI